jgi:hypothetical protein
MPKCAGEFVIAYEPGLGPEDFYAIEDTVRGDCGHDVDTLPYWDRDCQTYGDEMHDRYQEAREAYYQRKGEDY